MNQFERVMAIEAQMTPKDPSTLFDYRQEVRNDDVRWLLDELRRVKLEAINAAYDTELKHRNEVEGLKVQFSERALEWQITHEREIADLHAQLDAARVLVEPKLPK